MITGAPRVQWPEGTRDSLEIYAPRGGAIALHPSPAPSAQPPEREIPADSRTRSSTASVRQTGLAKDLVLEITEASRVVPPGGVVTLKYVLYSAEGEVERIRLQVDVPPGWSVLDAELVERERLLEAWEIITEDLRIAVPPDALLDKRQLIRLTAQVEGEPGTAEALTHVHILNGGGLTAGSAHLAGTATLTASGLEPWGLENARTAGIVDLSGKLGQQTTLSLSYRQGPQESLSNYRSLQEEKYFSSAIRHDGWNLEFGNQISSVGNVLTGPSVNGDGVALRRMDGRMTGEVVLAQPTTFNGEEAGHLWRGNLGIKTAVGTFGFAASDFERPEGGYSTLPPILDPTLDPDSLEALERERELSLASGSTRVQGVGMEANLQLAHAHRLVLRGGLLRLENAQADGVSAPSVEAQYSFSARSATFNTRWRQTPPSVQGVYIPGDELSVDGSLRLIGEMRLVARAYQYESQTLGADYQASTADRSLGLRYSSQRWRVEVQGKRRETHSSSHSLRHTGQVSLGLPLGPISLSANTEIGEEENPQGTYPFRSHRGDLRWSGDPGFVSLRVSSYETGGAPRRLRADLLASVMLGEFEFAGGAWATRGWSAGGEPSWWMNVGLPVTSELTLLVGVEHAQQPDALDASPWRTSLGLRKKLILPLPFLSAS